MLEYFGLDPAYRPHKVDICVKIGVGSEIEVEHAQFLSLHMKITKNDPYRIHCLIRS